MIDFNPRIYAVIRHFSWAVRRGTTMIGMRLLESAIQVGSSTGMVAFFDGLFLLAGIFYFFAKHSK